MNPLSTILAAISGYLLGSISFARLFFRWLAPDQDLEELEIPVTGEEPGQKVDIFGANAASMVLGPRLGIIIALCDMAKVAIPMIVYKVAFPESSLELLVGVGGLIGHNWPLYHRFKGGRGFSVIYASFLVLDWVGALITPVIGLLLGMVGLQNITIGYLAWLWLMVPWFYFRGEPYQHFYYALVVNLIFILAVIPEGACIFKNAACG